MTEEKILQNSHIGTQDIKQDIADTEKEIIDMQDEHEVLMRNPTENKLRIYFLEGGIASRKHFIEDLNSILEYRKNHV